MVINHNGSGEVADLIVVTENRFILINAKYSAQLFAGLRVDDIQVVCSQALKNIRFFMSDAYKKYVTEDSLQKGIAKNSLNTPSLLDFLSTKLSNPNLDKECWIIQPGLSKKGLAADEKNKIHGLFNFIDGIMKAQNIRFKVFGSERVETDDEHKARKAKETVAKNRKNKTT
jgi:hypothetical protein